MSRPDCPPENDAGRAERVTACMTAFASALKNITVYPADHPRVIERASAFVAEHKALACRSNELLVGKDDLELDGVSIPTDHLAVNWLQRRCRETGIASIHIEPNCRARDVILFACALIDCRPGSGDSLPDTWADSTASIRPVALVIEDRHVPEHAPAPVHAEDTGITPNASLQDKLKAIAGMPSVRQLGEAIANCDTSGEEATESVDLLAMITEVLPVDCPTDLAGLQQTIEDILQRTRDQLQEAARTDSTVRSAHLLRSAVDIAKTYFGRSNQAASGAPQQPSGRPGDEAIQADVDALIRKLATLPDASDVRLPPATELAEGAPTSTKELLGICLHGMTTAEEPSVRSNRMRIIAALVQHRPTDCIEVLDTYLLPGRRSTAIRLSVLGTLVDNGLDSIVRDRNYLDDELLRAGFPEVLPIAARTFASPDEQARVRLALEDLATLIENGGAQAVAEAGLLEDVATVQLLSQCGGKVALQLLAHCEADAAHVQRALLHCLQNLELPECEDIVVNVCAKNDIPIYYIRRLLRAAAKHQFDDSLRNASAELIREFVHGNLKELPAATLSPAIDALRSAPGHETEQFLREVARLGRFSLRPDLRELRQHAMRTLEALDTKVWS